MPDVHVVGSGPKKVAPVEAPPVDAPDPQVKVDVDEPAAAPHVEAEAQTPRPDEVEPAKVVEEAPSRPTNAADAERAATVEAELAKALDGRGIDQPMFRDADPQTKSKVNTALKGDPIPADGGVREAAQGWALQGAGGNPREFANRYEYARAMYLRVRARLQPSFAGKEGGKKKLAAAAGAELTPEKLTQALAADLDASVNLGPGQGLRAIEGLAPEDIGRQVQALDRVAFESPTAEAYHAVKHDREIPPSLRATGDVVTDYAMAAQDTIRTGDVVSVKDVSEDSTRVLIQKAYCTAEERVVLEAIVYVKAGGRVVLASYGAAKADK